MRSKTPRRSVSSQVRAERPATWGGQRGVGDGGLLMSDTLSDGRRIRVLTVLDVFTREGLALRADFRFTADQVVSVLSGAGRRAGRALRSIRVDNGPEFTGRSAGPVGPTSTA